MNTKRVYEPTRRKASRFFSLAIANTSPEGWKDMAEIGVVRCSRDLMGSGSSVVDGILEEDDLEREATEYKLTIPVDDLDLVQQRY